MSQNPLLAVDGEEAVGAHASPVPCSRMCNRDVDGKLSFALSSLVGKKFGDR